jgi:carbamoylphosphate synthase large subunit
MEARMKAVEKRPVGTPCVVFIDDFAWNGFNQFSVQLRREGIRTLRINAISFARPRFSARFFYDRFSARLLYDRYETLADDQDVNGLRALLSSENVIDVQFVETLGDIVLRAADVLNVDTKAALRHRVEMTDKLFVSKLFNEAGVRTPATVPLARWSPEQAAESLGLPLVVKDRVGSGGRGVIIAHNLNQLHHAVAQQTATLENRYFEQYVDGEKLNYGAVFGPAGFEQELLYRVTNWVQPVGSAIEVETIDDEQLAEFGRKAVEVSGCVGVMNIDVLRDRDGADWLIDFNPRVFGGGTNFLQARLNIAHGYLHAYGLRTTPPAVTRPLSGVTVRIFPNSLNARVLSGSYLHTMADFVVESGPYLKWLGFRYWFAEALSTVAKVWMIHRRTHSSKE